MAKGVIDVLVNDDFDIECNLGCHHLNNGKCTLFGVYLKESTELGEYELCDDVMYLRCDKCLSSVYVLI